MKKPLKKVLAVILSAIMLLSCSATSVFAAPGGSSSIFTALKTVKTVVDYGKSVVTLGKEAVDFSSNLPKRVLNIGISYVKLQKANGDLVKAVLKDGVTTVTLPVKLLVSNVKLGGAAVGATVDTASGSVKFVIALAQFPPAVLKDTISVGKLNNAVASGLGTNLVNDVKLGVNGVKVAKSAKDLVSPSLSDIIEDIKLPIYTGTAIKNIVEIAKGDEDENAKPLVGTPMITDHGEENTVEETSLSSEEEEAPTTAAEESVAVVANTDGPMD